MSRPDRLVAPLFSLLLAIMAAHESEHFAQVAQKDVVLASCPNECRGFLGFVFDVEWIHFVYNTSILLVLIAFYAGFHMWRPGWRENRLAWGALTAGILVQAYHVVEHTEKLHQWLDNGHHSPTPGFLGKTLGEADGRNFSLIELHFFLNTIVFVLVFVAYLAYGFHRKVWADRTPRRLALVGVSAVLVAIGSGYVWAQRPPTIHLSAGVHRGPFVLARASRLVGEPGTIVRGPILVRSDDVVVRNVAVRVRGDFGIDVDGAKDVVLDRVRVSGARLDAIHVRRSSVVIRHCKIDSRGLSWAQGIDISYSTDLPPSTVSGCTIVGGLQGIVSHSALVHVRGNHVARTSIEAIAVTEMSMGTVERNHVEDSLGVGIFCGDHSMCDIQRNQVTKTRPDLSSQDLTRLGYAIQVHFGATANLSHNRLERNARNVGVFFGAQIERHG